jgi:hypothetical protein
MTMKLVTWSVPCVLVGTLLGCKADSTPHASNATKAATAGRSSAAGQAAGKNAGADSGAASVGLTSYPDLRGGCDINSGYPDDHACLPAPAPEEGMQIHIGPANYQDADEVAKYLLKPGEETDACWTFHTPNDKPIHYQTFVISGRSGTHHIINTMYRTEMPDGGFGTCADPGTGTNGDIIDNLPGASKAYMPRGTVAPENLHIGRAVPANVTAQADMHYYNFTDHDILREFWMNIYFAKDEDITQEADQIRGMGGTSWNYHPIPAKSDMVYKYACPIKGEGRIVALLGHYHSHGKRFTASVQRASGTIDKVFEMYDYLDPATFQYDTVNDNPEFSDSGAGAVSGMLAVHDGDTMLWECHVVNDSDVGLTYTNHLKTGEMCNLWGESLGIDPLNCVLP